MITLRLETCDDNTPINGGHARWGNGAAFGSTHFPIVAGENTGSSADGETAAEFFPGVYSFEMGLNGTTNVKSLWNFPADGATIIWQTTNVTLNYSGSISFGGPTGQSRWFIKPSMELMPGGTYNFLFQGYGLVALSLTECSMTYTPITNLPPVALCQDITVDADDNCEAICYS